jgi:hypothetical protein
MSNDPLLTVLFYMAFIITFVVVYLVPVAGVVTGSILLRKRPERKVLGLSVLSVSIVLCLVVAICKLSGFLITS